MNETERVLLVDEGWYLFKHKVALFEMRKEKKTVLASCSFVSSGPIHNFSKYAIRSLEVVSNQS